MSNQSLKEKTAGGLLWGGLSNGLQQLLNLLFGIILGRILSVNDYGMVGMLTIFSAMAAALQEGGFIAALTNRKEATHRDFNSVFWFSATCSLLLYLILFFSAPLIARFYGNEELIPLARVTFLGFVISSFSLAPRAILFRNLKIKESTIVSLTSLVVSGITGVILATHGFAYWGIALQSITFVFMVTLLNFYFSHWHPTFEFDFQPIREMVRFSSKLVITNLCNIINGNLFNVLLGALYSEREVGNFTQANKWNSMGHTFITGMLSGVAQPVFTQVNEDPTRQLAIFRKLIRFAAFVSFPALWGLGLISEELIVLALTDKWQTCAHILRLLCTWGAFAPLSLLCSTLLISRGHSTTYLGCTVAQILLQLSTACLIYPYGLEWMLRIYVAIQIGWLFVWHYFVHREIGLRLIDLLRDLAPYLLLTLVLVTTADYLTAGIESLWLRMGAKMAFVGTCYLLVLWKMQSVIFMESVHYLLKKRRIS